MLMERTLEKERPSREEMGSRAQAKQQEGCLSKTGERGNTDSGVVICGFDGEPQLKFSIKHHLSLKCLEQCLARSRHSRNLC